MHITNVKSNNLIRINNISNINDEKLHNLPSTAEWQNSSFYFNKNMNIYGNIKDKLAYPLISSYFNSIPVILNKYKIKRTWWSVQRVFIGKPEIKHSVNEIVILVYSFNKQKSYLIKKIKKITKLFMSKRYLIKHYKKLKKNKYAYKYRDLSFNNLIRYYTNLNNNGYIDKYYKNLFINKKFLNYSNNWIVKLFKIKGRLGIKNLFKKNFKKIGYIRKFIFKGIIYNNFVKPKTININLYLYNLITKFSTNNINIKKKLIISRIAKKIFRNKLKKIYLYKYYASLLYLNNLKFNLSNIVGLSNVLSKIYNKKVVINVIGLKYLYLDNSMFADAVVRKLHDRKKRVLRVMRKALRLAPIARLHHILLMKVEKKVIITKKDKKNKTTKPNNVMARPLNAINYKNIISNYIYRNHLYVYDNLKSKHLIGVRLQGTGRLTKRLTASRSILKYSTKGKLKNIYSSFQRLSAIMLKGNSRSNIQYLNINSYNRNGSFGLKSWSSNF